MKILPFKIPKSDNAFLTYQEDTGKNFYDKFHQHQEIQISYIANGSGTLVVGDSIKNYSVDDIIILGSNLPHLFIDDEKNGDVKMISIFFNLNESELNIFNLEELVKLKRFIKNSEVGFMLEKKSRKAIDIFQRFHSLTKIQSIISFLLLLDLLRTSKKIGLSNPTSNSNYSILQGERMQRVIDYSFENYNNPISLDAISQVANLSKNAFCKYFKKHTNKSYIQFLNELRVNSASKLLIYNPEMPIVEIAEASGFNNLSNFNRQFKKYRGMTPKLMRKSV